MILLKNTEDYRKMTAPEGARGSGGARGPSGGPRCRMSERSGRPTVANLVYKIVLV
jgi:hypothetical protein